MHIATPFGRIVAQPEDGTTASRIAAAVIVAAIVPTAIDVNRSVFAPASPRRGRRRRRRRHRRTPGPPPGDAPLAILATREHAGLSSAASVITQTSVVLRSSTWVQSGISSIAASSSGVERTSPSSARGPARLATSPITSPNAFTTASAATVSPRPLRAGGVADAGRRRALATQDLPHRAPDPAPTLPALWHPARRRLAGGVTGVGPGPRAGVALDEVVDHRRGDDRHEAPAVR